MTAETVAAGGVRIMDCWLGRREAYWIEMRPKEKGRYVIMKRTAAGKTVEVTPPPWNARTRVHEYGGAACAVDGATLYFSNFADQRIYRCADGGDFQPLTPEGDVRYADFALDATRGRIICVSEDHTRGDKYPTNTISAVPLSGGAPKVLVEGDDFYSNPRLSPDGARLAWLSWNHPNMPWDSTELLVADVCADGALAKAQRIAGGPCRAGDGESVYQPEWSPDGTLYFASDRGGWWNLYRLGPGGAVEAICEMKAEFGRPQWVFGAPVFGFAGDARVVCSYTCDGVWHLATLDSEGGLNAIETPYTYIQSLAVERQRVLIVAAGPTETGAVVEIDLPTRRAEVVARSMSVEIDEGFISAGEPIEFPTEGGERAHALFYPPRNRDFAAPEGELPPLIVQSHGGPTSAARAALSLSVQYFTSRGFAVVDVNYGGSTGYGREYRKRLEGKWGVGDVDDCCNATRYLIGAGKVDGKRLIIEGGSASGYTTLSALVFRDLFSAGASYYGISDVEALAVETHKFESRYLDRLIGAYPERADLYRERSPIHFVERLSCPVILFQGLEDLVVPPDQAERMVAALDEKGLPVAYLAFEGEQHGFRQAANIRRALEGELYFYSRILGFEPADKIEPVEIRNLA